MAKLNREQLEQMVNGLKLVMTKVKQSSVEKYNMRMYSECIIGTTFKDTYSNIPCVNFKRAFSQTFGYIVSVNSQYDEKTLSTLQLELRNIFYPEMYLDYNLSKDDWLKVAKKLLKRLEKKLASRS